MKKKLFIIITGVILVGFVCIWLLVKNKSAEQMTVDRLNEAVSHYTDMNIKDDKTYSLKVSDTEMLVTTYVPEYSFFGVSTDAYTVRPCKIDERSDCTRGDRGDPAGCQTAWRLEASRGP